jgi:hypothetical protein
MAAVAECFSDSGPSGTHGAMTPDDWRRVISDAAAMGVREVQLIGGEPTTHPAWPELVDHALSLGLGVEVYSNWFHIKPGWWGVLALDGVTLATSYYSDRAEEHDAITTRPDSYERTRANIAEAVRRGIPLRRHRVRPAGATRDRGTPGTGSTRRDDDPHRPDEAPRPCLPARCWGGHSGTVRALRARAGGRPALGRGGTVRDVAMADHRQRARPWLGRSAGRRGVGRGSARDSGPCRRQPV